MATPETWHLLVHTAGPNADRGVALSRQDWFPEHRGFHAALVADGLLVAAGPLPAQDGAGMTLVRGIGTEEITRRARADAAVAGGYLDLEVRPWVVVETVVPVLRDAPNESARPAAPAPPGR